MKNQTQTFLAVIAVSAFLFLSSACAPNDAALPGEAKVEGDSLIIDLEENPTTGFSWVYDDYDTAVLELIDDEYIPDETDSDVVGSGGIHHYEFKGLSEGETTLTFRYLKSWEGKDSAEETRTINIAVDQIGKIEIAQ